MLNNVIQFNLNIKCSWVTTISSKSKTTRYWSRSKYSIGEFMSMIKVFELAKQYNAPIIYASSSAVYGNLPLGSDQRNKFSITSPYAQDKMTTEHYAKMVFDNCLFLAFWSTLVNKCKIWACVGQNVWYFMRFDYISWYVGDI